MPRVFLAIPVPEEVHTQIRTLLPEGKLLVRTRPEQLHVTLHFLGTVTEATTNALVHGLSSGCTAPFELSLEGLGCFRISETRGVLWCGLKACSELQRLQRRLADQLLSLGLAPEMRPWVPHVTIARFNPRQWLELDTLIGQHRSTFLGNFRVTHFRLYDSVPGPDGSQYTVLNQYPLNGTGSAQP